MTLASTPLSDPDRPALPRRRSAPWFIVEGILLILLGVAAAALPILAGVAAALVFGWVLILSGIFGFVSLFGARAHTHLVWGGISAAIALLVGLAVVIFPLAGAVALAIFIAAYLFIDALAMGGLAMDQRKHGGRSWIWLILAAVVSFILAIIVLALGPRSDAILIGVIVAIDLVVGGFALISLGWAARKSPV